MRLEISEVEYKRRTDAVVENLKDENLSAFVFWNAQSVFYLTGFAFLPTERPCCLVFEADGKKTLFVPQLEIEHAGECEQADEVLTYQEYPDETHPLQILGTYLNTAVPGNRIGSDSDGYSSPSGYEGPRLSEVLPTKEVVIRRRIVEKLRLVKTQEEIDLIRMSARWGAVAHALVQKYSKPGVSENYISMRASAEATMQMIEALGSAYRPLSTDKTGVTAYSGFRGQVGAHSALPHSITINAVLQPGDVLVTRAGASVAGYGSELERTMFVGEPDAQKANLFKLMMGAREAAFNKIRAGVLCSEVDKVVREFYKKHDLWDYWRHHTGHGLGLLNHEAPFLDVGCRVPLQAGMVLCVEPGLYVPGLGGFRHSDTILVTESGFEFISEYPRELSELICG